LLQLDPGIDQPALGQQRLQRQLAGTVAVEDGRAPGVIDGLQIGLGGVLGEEVE
jgi:hypothetical protein